MQTPGSGQPTGQISPDGNWMWNGTQWVPNPYRPTPTPSMAAPYESAAGRAGIASIFIYVSIAGIVLLVAASIAIDLVSDPGNNLGVSLLSLLALIVWIGTFAAAIVFFCLWLHRVVRNMPSLGSPDPRWSPARSVLYSFIPIVWFFFPLWSVLDAWRGADTSRRWLDQGTRRTLPAPQLLAAWWAAWLGGNFVSNIGGRFTGPIGLVFDVTGGVGQIVAALLVVMVIRRLTSRQDRKNELISSGQLV